MLHFLAPIGRLEPWFPLKEGVLGGTLVPLEVGRPKKVRIDNI